MLKSVGMWVQTV